MLGSTQQARLSGYRYHMPAMLWLYNILYTSHASYALCSSLSHVNFLSGYYLYLIPDMPAMLWLYTYTSHASYALCSGLSHATCQLCSGYILYTSHASYALAYLMPAMLWLLFVPDMPAMLYALAIYSTHMPAMLLLIIPCQLCSGYIHPMPAMFWLIPCQLCSGYYLYLTCQLCSG